jgi:hypothetical protein
MSLSLLGGWWRLVSSDERQLPDGKVGIMKVRPVLGFGVWAGYFGQFEETDSRTGVTISCPENCVAEKPIGKLCSADRERSRGDMSNRWFEHELVGFGVS